MKIIALQAENIKKLVAVEIRPDGNLVQITGKNGQGKTSVLDSIWWAIAGAKNIQAAPIRKGASTARIHLDMGELIVTRTFKRDKEGSDGFTTKLEVAGNVKGLTPQAMLDSLLDSLAFDPLSFSRMGPKEQFEALRKYVPDVDFDKLASANSIDAANRKEINRRAKEERILADQINLPADIPALVDEEALVKELTAAGKHNADVQLRAENRRQVAATIDERRVEVSRLKEQANAILERAGKLEAEAATLEEKIRTAPELPAPISTDGIERKIAEAKQVNVLVARRSQKALHQAAADKLEAESKTLTTRMEDREEEKRAKIAAAKLPIESITFGDGVVLLNGVPFDQGSDAEQLRASCALAMAGNPALRVLRVRDGSLLDKDSLELLATMAEERDYQVWIERVGTGEVGFELRDGSVAVERSIVTVEHDDRGDTHIGTLHIEQDSE